MGDSGASLAVANLKSDFPGATLRPSEASKNGTTYANADESPRRRKGEFDAPFKTIAGHQRRVCFQDAPVMFLHISLGGVADAGNRVILDSDYDEIINK